MRCTVAHFHVTGRHNDRSNTKSNRQAGIQTPVTCPASVPCALRSPIIAGVSSSSPASQTLREQTAHRRHNRNAHATRWRPHVHATAMGWWTHTHTHTHIRTYRSLQPPPLANHNRAFAATANVRAPYKKAPTFQFRCPSALHNCCLIK